MIQETQARINEKYKSSLIVSDLIVFSFFLLFLIKNKSEMYGTSAALHPNGGAVFSDTICINMHFLRKVVLNRPQESCQGREPFVRHFRVTLITGNRNKISLQTNKHTKSLLCHIYHMICCDHCQLKYWIQLMNQISLPKNPPMTYPKICKESKKY